MPTTTGAIAQTSATPCQLPHQLITYSAPSFVTAAPTLPAPIYQALSLDAGQNLLGNIGDASGKGPASYADSKRLIKYGQMSVKKAPNLIFNRKTVKL